MSDVSSQNQCFCRTESDKKTEKDGTVNIFDVEKGNSNVCAADLDANNKDHGDGWIHFHAIQYENEDKAVALFCKRFRYRLTSIRQTGLSSTISARSSNEN